MGPSAVLAGLALSIAAGLLILFFVNENEVADRLSNWFFALFYGAMMWTLVETHRYYIDVVPWFWIATVVSGAALALLFVTTVLVITNRVQFARVAIVQAVGFAVIVIWVLTVSILILTEGGLPKSVGWFGVAVSALTVIMLGSFATDRELLRGERRPGPVMNSVMALVLLGLTAWTMWFGLAPWVQV